MSRIKLDLPKTFVFSTELSVRVSDLNYGGHVGNDSMLRLMQEARISFYRALGSESEIKLAGTVGQLVADVVVVYQAESFYGDVLLIQIAVADVSKYGFDLFYRITNKETAREVAKGKTGIVCFDFAKRKLAPIPDSLLEKIKDSESL